MRVGWPSLHSWCMRRVSNWQVLCVDEGAYINLEQWYLRQSVFARPTIFNVNNFPAYVNCTVSKPFKLTQLHSKKTCFTDEETKECDEAVKYYPCIYHGQIIWQELLNILNYQFMVSLHDYSQIYVMYRIVCISANSSN